MGVSEGVEIGAVGEKVLCSGLRFDRYWSCRMVKQVRVGSGAGS